MAHGVDHAPIPTWPQVARSAAVFAGLFTAMAAPLLLGRPVPWAVAGATVLLGAMLALLAAWDHLAFRLPDLLTLPLLAYGLGATWLIGAGDLRLHALAAVLAGATFWLTALAYRALRGRDGLGLGDAKLFAALGAWVGVGGLATTLLLACLTAIVALLAARVAGRAVTSATPVPFGVFLALGGWATWIYGPLV
jgi:leader peptidase (prepilin peptidase)/N-methyltransferase